MDAHAHKVSEVDIARALEIQGWMSERELTWLALQAHFYSYIVEIGSFCGRSTRALADNTSGVVFAIDDFHGPRDVEIPDTDRAKIFNTFMANMDGLSQKVVPVVGNHARLTEFPVRPDMVFIDGGHTYEDVRRDISFWKPIISPGGLLCGHDYGWPGVQRAVDELVPGAEVVTGTSIWFKLV